MPRNDAILYSGASSASFGEVKEDIRKEIKEAKIKEQKKLAPVSDLVMGELQKEIDNLKNIDYLDIEAMLSDDQFRAEMMARKKTVEKLTAVKSRMASILRTK